MNDAEKKLLEELPHPPHAGFAQIGGVVILEWLQDIPSERRTGLELHQFLEQARPGWSRYIRCHTKNDLMDAINQAQSPQGCVLHIECHGCDEGLGDGSSGSFLTWDELNPHLQSLNQASNCNLIVFVAACTGFAAILALTKGPRAPAIALVGPDQNLSAQAVADASFSFYQTLMDGDSHLSVMSRSSTQESNTHFETQSMVELAFEVWLEKMIVDARPDNRDAAISAVRQRLINEGQYTPDKEVVILKNFSQAQANAVQDLWDHFFMIDTHPENSSRFGVDFKEIARRIEKFHGRK